MTHAPPIDDAIAAREAKIAQLRRELEIEEAELRGMKLAVDSFIGAAAKQTPPPIFNHGRSKHVIVEKVRGRSDGYRGGRQPGAISQEWRRILSELYWRRSELNGPGQSFPIGAVVDAAARQGIRLRPSEAEARLQHYGRYKYVTVAATDFGKYIVTADAAEKFGFDKEPMKNEAPSAEAPGPQESVDNADQTGAVEPPEKGKGLYD